MSGGREQKKVELMREAEALIDELLDWTASAERPNLSQIEEEVLKLRQRFSEEMTQAVVEVQEAKQPAVGPRCTKCGQVMSYKGQKKVRVQTWVGELELERGYYHCAACQEGFFPPG